MHVTHNSYIAPKTMSVFAYMPQGVVDDDWYTHVTALLANNSMHRSQFPLISQ